MELIVRHYVYFYVQYNERFVTREIDMVLIKIDEGNFPVSVCERREF